MRVSPLNMLDATRWHERIRRLLLFAWTVVGGGYVGTGWHLIPSDEVALVRRNGCWLRDEQGAMVHPPGPLWVLPYPFDQVMRLSMTREEIVHVEFAATENTDQATFAKSEIPLVLTGDEHLLEVHGVAKFRIVDPLAYVTVARDPRQEVRNQLAMAMTRVLGRWSIGESLGMVAERPSGDVRSLSSTIAQDAQNRIDQLGLGITITSLEVAKIVPPQPVLDAFNAVQTARIEQETLLEEARGQREETLIDAEAQAAQEIAEARGAREGRIAQAGKQVALFQAARALSMKISEAAAREVLRREVMEVVLRKAGRVYYLPADKSNRQLRVLLPEEKPR